MGDEGWGDLQKQRLAEKVNGQTADDTTPARVAAGGLTDDEREALSRAGDHHPDVCDCTGRAADVRYEPGWGEICGALEDTYAVVERILAARAAGGPDAEQPDFRPAIIRGLEARFKAVLAACELAEAEARHVVDDEVYVSVGLIRNALRTTTPAAGGPDDGTAERARLASIWRCYHSMHDTERCTPTKHYYHGEA